MMRLPRSLCLLAMACYASSFLMPTFEIVVGGKGDTDYGYTAFVVALMAANHDLFGGPPVFLVWLANPAFWAAVVLFFLDRTRSAGRDTFILNLGRSRAVLHLL